ncbi:MotB family protein [Methylobacterium radiodurans]|uniref:MotB family protein n=1 Tax=Methylobacterium radiodurans TaxID=2202828 RepID=A0A2U8VV88_9HYPH|nr:MotB family protein [Methylobacterium radiodurans]AWN37615.1 MotB family protein [Methylobacterium radiodurans]
MSEGHQEIIIIKRHGDHEDGHHGGAWKIALADFMTAMMALFLVMWLINSTSKAQKQSIAEYFNPVKLAEVTHDRKGLSDPQDAPSDPASAGGGKADAEGKGDGEGKGEGKGPDKGQPAPPGSRARESALFQDPYAVLAKLAAEGERSEVASADASAQDGGLPGISGGEAARDPFDPLYWQTEALPKARSAQPGKVDTVARAPSETRLDARAQSMKDGKDPAKDPKAPAKPLQVASADAALPAAVRDALGPVRPKAAEKAPDAKDAQQEAALPPAKEIAKEPVKEPVKDAPKDEAADPRAGETAAMAEIKAEIARAVQPAGTRAPAPRVEVRRTGEGVLISVTDEINFSMFEIGSAEPAPKVVRALERIAKILNARPGRIVVRGHTDGRPFRSETYDNWRLSSARAQMASYALVRAGLDEGRLERIEGYADRQPRNPDPKAAENRRIEILLRGQPE